MLVGMQIQSRGMEMDIEVLFILYKLPSILLMDLIGHGNQSMEMIHTSEWFSVSTVQGVPKNVAF